MVEFLLGGLFLYICLPILESLMSAICTVIEVFKAKCSVKITKYNSEIAEINMALDSPTAHSIGFQYTPEEEDEEEYED